LCTLHFQREATIDNIASSLLFGDGAAAVLITADDDQHKGLRFKGFYSEVITKGKRDMAWELSSSGFLMTLSGYIPELLEEDFAPMVDRALLSINIEKNNITNWCIHPGGKRILEAIHRSLGFMNGNLKYCYDVMRDFGNMSSPTILFVLKNIMKDLVYSKNENVFCAAFGPGLTMETFIASPI
ncbi:MAG: type III polyketide synthase, partial [Bacteroidota bacterium]|nr:type III polyketide synthase [Bacteroidota bacterium]